MKDRPGGFFPPSLWLSKNLQHPIYCTSLTSGHGPGAGLMAEFAWHLLLLAMSSDAVPPTRILNQERMLSLSSSHWPLLEFLSHSKYFNKLSHSSSGQKSQTMGRQEIRKCSFSYQKCLKHIKFQSRKQIWVPLSRSPEKAEIQAKFWQTRQYLDDHKLRNFS